jgi:CubicO group peptidase (beta-lactamase class C family)
MSTKPQNLYFPPPESKGGWRYLIESDKAADAARMNLNRLNDVEGKEKMLFSGDSWAVAVIRYGYLVKEMFTFNVEAHTRFDIWSGSKAFTGTAWGMLLDDISSGRLPGQDVSLESRAYDYIPEGIPMTDPGKDRIKIKHLLTMTSGIPGESCGVIGMPVATGNGLFEHALGRCANRAGKWVDKLAAEPGTRWDYSDAGMCHLAIAFRHISGCEIGEYMQKRVFGPVGMENVGWSVQGGSGFLGPHTNAHSGLCVSARELARFGYLMLNKGCWEGECIVPESWIDMATKSSQTLNPNYGYTWWVNTAGTKWPGLPRDAFALSGFRSNKCYVIPSLDLVVARVGSGPVGWNEHDFIGGIVSSVIE